MLILGDDGVEYEDGLDENGNPVGESTSEIEDRGDNLGTDLLEVDEDILAALAGDEKNDRVIPKSRFDEVNNEKNDLKAQNALLLKQIAEGTAPVITPAAVPAVPAAPDFDLDAKEAAYIEAVIEGDTEGAAVIRKEIRKFERDSLLVEVRTENAKASVQEIQEADKGSVIAQAFIDHPQLNSIDASYDATLVGKINRMNMAYLSEGMTPADALKAAIADFVQPPAAPAAKVDVPARARNAAAAAAQPPNLGGIGTGERAAKDASVDVEAMDEAEYDALPEREKKRLRGD